MKCIGCDPHTNAWDSECPVHGERKQHGQWPDEEWPDGAEPEVPFHGPDD